MDHRFALITGASSGIGQAFARALPATTGLLLTGRDAGRLAGLREELAATKRPVEIVAADLSGDEGRAAVIEAAAALPIDLLINNAGLGRYGRFLENDSDTERRMAEVNVMAPLILTRALLPDMLARARETGRRAGVIVLASTAGFMPLPYLSTYAATKAFDLHWAEGLAGELSKEPVEVLALCPGATETPFLERAGLRGSSLPVEHGEDPAEVARQGLAALGKQVVHVVGARNRLTSLLATRLPREMVRRGTRSFMRRGLKRRPA